MAVVQRSPTAGIHGTQIVIPATAGIHTGGRRWVPVSTGTTGGGGAPTIIIPRRQAAGAPTIVIPATAGIHSGGPAMGFPLHRNDGGRRRTTIVIPATAGIHRGGPAMGSPLHRNDGGRRRTHNHHSTTAGGRRTHDRHSRDGGNPQRGAGDGFPSPLERRQAAGAPTIVIPATAGIHRGGAGDGFPSPPERRQAAGAPNSSFPRRRESTAGPAMGSRLHGNDGGRRRTHNRHPRDGGNPQRGAAFLSAAPNRYRGGRRRARRRTCDTMTSAGIDRRSTRRRPAAPTLVGSMQPAAQRTCQS